MKNFHQSFFSIGPSDYAIQIPITDVEKQEILDKHNEFRAAVPSRYMFKLYWDDELARIAQAHSDMCAFDHDLAVNRLSPKFGWKNGQNMVMTSEYRTSLANLLDRMFSSEKENFRYGDKCHPRADSCLHYTQAMLSNMTRVGCGHTHCLYPDRIERFLVCNYIHSQYQHNYNTPYIPSKMSHLLSFRHLNLLISCSIDLGDTSAIACPSKKSGNLCDCGNKICNDSDGEYLEPDTCDCRKAAAKRSIDKRDEEDDQELNNNNQRPFVALPSSKNLGSIVVNKRNRNMIPEDNNFQKNHRQKLNSDPNVHGFEADLIND